MSGTDLARWQPRWTPPISVRDRLPDILPSSRRIWYVAAFAAVLFACLALSGQLPGLTASNTTAVAQDSAVQCLANHGLSRLPLSCPEVGLPTGERLFQGLPVFLVAWSFTEIPGVSAHAGGVLADMLVVLLGLLGAARLMRRFGLGQWLSLAAAAVYVVSPSFLALVSFGGTYWGLLLLPAIVAADAFLLDQWRTSSGRRWILIVAAWFLLRLAILLLDGYTFVLTTTAAVLLAPAAFRGMRPRSIVGSALAYVGSAALAYLGYQLYVPGGDFAQSSLDLFRAMGLDVVTLVQPAPLQWWSHITGHQLDGRTLWGDGTNSSGNYLGFLCLGLAIFGTVRFRKSRGRLVAGLVACFLVGLVMSLGPSLKVDDRRAPLTGELSYSTYLMPSNAATVTLPSSVLHDKVPGVDQMRAAYRWLVLTRFGLIALAALGIQAMLDAQRRQHVGTARRMLPAFVGVLAIAEIFPNPAHLISSYRSLDRQRQGIYHVGEDLRHALPAGSVVVFASEKPSGGDYLAPLLVTAAKLRSYNIGDDKARGISSARWPAEIKRLLGGQASPSLVARVLQRDEADAVVIPRFSLRWSTYAWPPAKAYQVQGDDFAHRIAENAELQVSRYPDFYVVRLQPVG